MVVRTTTCDTSRASSVPASRCKIGRNICSLDVLGTGLVECSQLRCREPGVEDGSVRGHVGDTYCCCSLCAHGTRDYWVVGGTGLGWCA